MTTGRSLVATLAVALLPIADAAPAPVRVEASRLSMGCLYTIVAYGERADAVSPLLEAALDEVDRLDRLLSHYKADSPLSRLNREASRGPVVVDRELFDLIARSIAFSVESGGAFDITVGPLMKAWGFFGGEGHVPIERTLAEARQRVGYRHVRLDRARTAIAFDRDGVELDLGGIGKGYAVDRVVSLLRARGIDAALVSAGGSTVYGLGAPPDASGWSIDVQDPRDPLRVAFAVRLRDRALSIAGGSEKFFEAGGVRYAHIMDPRTGRPVQGISAVAVLSADGTTGDALDDAVFVLGVDRGRALLRRHPGVEAFVAKNGVGRVFQFLQGVGSGGVRSQSRRTTVD